MRWGYSSRPVTFVGGRGLICPEFGMMKWFFSMGWQNSWNQLRELRQMALAGEMPWSCWGGTKQCWDAAEGEESSGDGQQTVQKLGDIVYPILPPTAWALNSFGGHRSTYPAFFCRKSFVASRLRWLVNIKSRNAIYVFLSFGSTVQLVGASWTWRMPVWAVSFQFLNQLHLDLFSLGGSSALTFYHPKEYVDFWVTSHLYYS
jgi:hypothetical protein